MKVFLGLQEIAGVLSNLSKGFKKLGIESCVYDISENKFNYEIENDSKILLKTKKIKSKMNRSNKIVKILLIPIYEILMISLLMECIREYDVFIFSYFTSFFHFLDLIILKIFKKQIVYIFLGSDSRPTYISGNQIITLLKKYGKKRGMRKIYNRSKKKKRMMKIVEHFSDYIISYPAISQFNTLPFVKIFALGMPYDFDFSFKVEEKRKSIATRIVHAPSNPESKGSNIIREIINKLKSENYNIDYIELIDKKNSEVLAELSVCDFVIDQINSDSPLGVLGTEAAMFKKPSVLGGYYRNGIFSDHKKENVPPSFYCLPDSIEDEIRFVIENKDKRIEMGESAYEFVIRKWNSEKVAQNIIKMLNGELSKDAFFIPAETTYFKGSNLFENEIRELLRNYIAKYSYRGLFIDDKLNLIERIKCFLSIESTAKRVKRKNRLDFD